MRKKLRSVRRVCLLETEPCFKIMKYSSIFEIPITTRIRDATLRYAAAMNSAISPPSFVYWLRIVLSFIQLVGPCLLLSMKELWDSESVVFFVARVVGVFWQGWIEGEAQLMLSSAALLVVLVYLCLSSVAIARYYKRRVLSAREARIQTGVVKGFRTVFMPLEMCGLIHAYAGLIIDHDFRFMHFFVAVVALVVFGIEILVLRDSGVRILMEPSFSYSMCEWYMSTFHGLVAANCCLSSIGIVHSVTAKDIVITLMIAIYMINGILHWYYIPTMSCFYSTFLGSVSIGCGLVTAINLVCFHMQKRLGLYSILILVVIIVISGVIAAVLKSRYPMSVLGKMMMLEESGDDAEEKFSELFPSERGFERAVRISFGFLDPFILSWKPFRLALQKWPESHNIMLLWAKCLAIFPSETKQLKEIWKLFSSTQHETGTWLSYQLQIYKIILSRAVHVPSALASTLNSLSKSIDAIKLQQKRLLVNIMQTYTALFWQDLEHVNALIEELDIQFGELLDKFPNNQHVIDLYLKYIKQTKFDPQLEREWTVKQSITKEGGRLVDDIGYVAAVSLFPDLPDVCLFPQGPISDSAFRSQTESALGNTALLQQLQQESVEERHENQMLFVLHDLTEHSRVGSITGAAVTIVIGVLLSCIVFYFYANSFNRTTDDYMNKVNLFNEIGSTALESAHFAAFTAIGAIRELLDLTNGTLAAVAPTLMGECHALPEWRFSPERVTTKALSVRTCLEKLNRAFTTFGTKEREISKLYDQLFVDEYQNGLSFQDHYMQLIYDVLNLFESSLTSEEIYKDARYLRFNEAIVSVLNTLTSVSQEFYEVSDVSNSSVMSEMKDLIVVTILVVVVLIGLPFTVAYFSLLLIADTIASSFSSISVSAIKEVLERMGILTDDAISEGNSAAIRGSRDQKALSHCSGVILAYSASLLGIVVIGLILFFIVAEMKSQAWKLLAGIESLHYPITAMFTGMHQLTLIYQSSIIVGSIPDDTPMAIGRRYLKEGSAVWSNSFYGPSQLMANYIASTPQIYIPDCLSYVDVYALTPIESFIVSNYPDGLEREYLMLLQCFDSYNVLATNDTEKLYPALAYVMGNWQIEKRDTPYVDAMYGSLAQSLQRKQAVMIGSTVTFVLFQVVTGLILITLLIKFRARVRQSLQFFMYFKPSTILQNTTLVTLLSSGSLHDRDVDYKFKDADDVLFRLPIALVTCDKTLQITDHNLAFLTLVESNEPVVGVPLTSVLVSEGISTSLDAFLARLQQVLDGHMDPTFGMEFRFSTRTGKALVVDATVISLVSIGAARTQEDFSEITGFAILLEDLWPRKRRAEKIAQEERRINDIMKTVIPEKFIERFKQEHGYVSFGIGAGCFGRLRFDVDRLETDTDLSYLEVYDRIYKFCNAQIRIYPKIVKARSLSGVYEVASLQNEMGEEKRDKWLRECAIELMNFAGAVYQGQKELERVTGHTIKLTIAINASPAILSGIYTAEHPSYQILGMVLDFIDALEAKAAPGDFFAGQSLFELIYGMDSAYKADCMGQIQVANYQEAYYRYTIA